MKKKLQPTKNKNKNKMAPAAAKLLTASRRLHASQSQVRKVVFQPDYYMSAQFAGVAVAQRHGLYKRAGSRSGSSGLDVHINATVHNGHETAVLTEQYAAEKSNSNSNAAADLYIGRNALNSNTNAEVQ